MDHSTRFVGRLCSGNVFYAWWMKKHLSVGAGLAIGVIIGIAIDNLAMGIGIGLAIGIAMSFESKG
jgi:hypothetical protein